MVCHLHDVRLQSARVVCIFRDQLVARLHTHIAEEEHSAAADIQTIRNRRIVDRVHAREIGIVHDIDGHIVDCDVIALVNGVSRALRQGLDCAAALCDHVRAVCLVRVVPLLRLEIIVNRINRDAAVRIL